MATTPQRMMPEEHVARNKRITVGVLAFMFALLWLVIFAAGYMLGASPIFTGIVGVVVAGVYILVSMRFSVAAVLRATQARPVNEAVREEKLLEYRVQELAIAAGIPPPTVYIQESSDINAFATGLTPEGSVVCVTTGALQKLDQEEMEGVLAHELSHIVNHDMRVTTITIGVVGAIAMLAEIAVRVAFYGRGRRSGKGGGALILLALVLVILAPILSRMTYLFLSRRREYLADATGALLSRNPEGLARALEEIGKDLPDDPKGSRTAAGLYIANPWNHLTRSSVFSTHPPLEERIRRLRGM